MITNENARKYIMGDFDCVDDLTDTVEELNEFEEILAEVLKNMFPLNYLDYDIGEMLDCGLVGEAFIHMYPELAESIYKTYLNT